MGLTGWAVWAWVAAVLVPPAVLVITGLLHLDFQRARVRSGLQPLGLTETTRVVLAEAVAMWWFGWWHVRGLLGGPRPAETVEGRPVLCVHGYTQNGSNFWGLRRALEQAGRPTRSIFLGLAWPWRRLEGYAGALEAALERSADEPDGIDVVAHSMGGLVLRVVLAKRTDLGAHVRRVVTLGTPHRGTALARLGRVRPLDQLTHGAAFLDSLPSLGALLPHARITTMGSEADMLVYPVETAFQPGSAHVRFRRAGHAGLLVHRGCIDATVQALTTE